VHGRHLLPEFLIFDQLKTGKLRALSSLTLKSVGSYDFACPEEKAESPLLLSFRAWLLSQAQAWRPLQRLGMANGGSFAALVG